MTMIEWRPGYVSQWRDGELVTVKGCAPVYPSRIEEILAETAADYSISVPRLVEANRLRFYAWARFDAMTRLRAERKHNGDFRFSLFKISGVFSCDHTSVCSGLQKWDDLERDGVRLEDWYSPFNDAAPEAWVRAVKHRRERLL